MTDAAISDETLIHRIGGGAAANLVPKASELLLDPPGISIFQGGTAAEGAQRMRRQFPRKAPKGRTVVGTTTVGEVRKAGFDIIMDATRRFPNHARLIHPAGAAGFSLENLERLAKCFQDQLGL